MNHFNHSARRIFLLIQVVCLIFLLNNGQVYAAAADDFVITINTTIPGPSPDTEFIIPTYPGETYNFNVDCDNDGIDEITGWDDDYTCTYSAPVPTRSGSRTMLGMAPDFLEYISIMAAIRGIWCPLTNGGPVIGIQ